MLGAYVELQDDTVTARYVLHGNTMDDIIYQGEWIGGIPRQPDRLTLQDVKPDFLDHIDRCIEKLQKIKELLK